MILPFFSPLSCFSGIAGPEEDEEPSGANVLRLIQIRLAKLSLAKITLFSQANWQWPLVSDLSSRNTLRFSSAQKMKRFSTVYALDCAEVIGNLFQAAPCSNMRGIFAGIAQLVRAADL
jgi:hypothetical protein